MMASTSGTITPPLSPSGRPSGPPMMGSRLIDNSVMSVDLVPRLSMPPAVPSNIMSPTAAAMDAYGPGGYAMAAPPIERSQDLTNTGTSLNPGQVPNFPGGSVPQTMFPAGSTSSIPGPPQTMFPPQSMPLASGPPQTVPPMPGPMGSASMPPMMPVPASMPPGMQQGSMATGSVPPMSHSMPPMTMAPPTGPMPPVTMPLGSCASASHMPGPCSPMSGPPMLPPTAGGPPAMGSVSDVGSVSGGLGKELTVVVTRLLDMPERKTLFGKTKGFRVKAFDDDDRELGASQEIPPPHSPEIDSIQLEDEEGFLRLRTRSQLIYLQVEHVGIAGIMGNEIIGRCQIHRMDPRSSQIWPYALSEPDGSPANCGIELKVVERPAGAPPPVSASQIPSGSPFSTAPSRPPSLPPGSMRKPGWTFGEGSPSVPGMQDVNHGVSALLEFDKATDLPYPSDDSSDQLMIVVLDEEKNSELRRVGPFMAKDQRGGFRRLVMADCRGTRVFARAPLHFGGSAEEGAMFVKVGICYVRGPNDQEVIGVTEPIKVSWRPAEKKYYEIRQSNTRKVLGGIYLTHRLVTEGEMPGAPGSNPDLNSQNARRRLQPKVGGPTEAHMRISGRTGNFPAGSPEEAFEQAAINCEAQNRALLQKCKIADLNSRDDDIHVRTVNGYREWDSLDSLFSSMGPNPLAHSEDLGPAVARSYCETTNMLKELVPQLGPTQSVTDEQVNLRLIHMMHGEDPWKVTQTLRPVVCKDPEEIAGNRDMTWCPDPPVYAPLRNMSEQDKETMRLACFDPRQNAKLMFVDANPNYRIDEDVWGVLNDYKCARSLLVPKPESAYRRVKDDCIMS